VSQGFLLNLTGGPTMKRKQNKKFRIFQDSLAVAIITAATLFCTYSFLVTLAAGGKL